MAKKRILTNRASVNMVTADDVYTSDNHLIIPTGTVLTEEVIQALRDYSIFAIHVEAGEDGRPIIEGGAKEEDSPSEGEFVTFANPVSDITEIGANGEREEYFGSIRETKEFKEFHSSFLESVDHLKSAFTSVVMKNEKIDSKAILQDVQNVVTKGRNSIHILDMLQCMRGYDDATYVHSLNIALIANMIGKIVYPDMPQEELDVLTMSGMLCDIGKLMVPEEVMMKKGRLTLGEYNIAKTHVFHGNNILKRLDLDPRIAEVAMRHHERCDGSGYPGGFRRDQIEEFARIVAIADTYDAMTSDRVYRAAMCPFDVIHMFEREGLVKYDVEFLLPFLEQAVQAYVNAEVQLSTDEIGKVIMINQKEFSKPIVQVGDSFYDLAADASIGISKVIM